MKLRIDPGQQNSNRQGYAPDLKEQKLESLSGEHFFVLLEMWELLTGKTIGQVDYKRGQFRLQSFQKWSKAERERLTSTLEQLLRDKADDVLLGLDDMGSLMSGAGMELVYVRLHNLCGDLPMRLVRLRVGNRQRVSRTMGAGTDPAPTKLN